MANNKRIQIQHWYTTGSTAPAASALTLGEIAIATSAGTEAIFIKNNTGGTVDFPTRKQIIDYVDLKTKGIATSGEIESLDNKITKHITGDTADNKVLGHVTLVGGDLDWATGNTITVGEAAASHHTHGQYLEESLLNTDNGFVMTPATNITPKSYGVKAGTGITVDSNGVSIIDEYRSKIANGVTAFNWGDHATKGYAKNDVLTAHTTNGNIHVTPGDKDRWNAAEQNAKAYASGYTNTEIEKVTNRITPLETSANTWNDTTAKFNAFISGGEANEALDTLVEIQNFLSGDTTGVQAMLETISALTNTVSENTDDIKTLSGTVSGNTTEITSLKNSKVETIDTVGNLSATVTNLINNPKKYTITHTTAGAQTSAITATNDTTGLSFGSEFEIVNKVGYDKNGHVVSGATQILSLPDLPTASTENYGVVKLKSGELTFSDEFFNNNESSSTAAGVAHGHTEYVKYNDLTSYDGSEPLVISCGIY